jgi:hypothetical protein
MNDYALFSEQERIWLTEESTVDTLNSSPNGHANCLCTLERSRETVEDVLISTRCTVKGLRIGSWHTNAAVPPFPDNVLLTKQSNFVRKCRSLNKMLLPLAAWCKQTST